MSTLKVNQVQTTAGKPILNSTGSVLQVVSSNTLGLTGELSTSSASYVTTGLSVTIVPTSSTSKLFVEFVGNGKFNSGSGDDGVTFKIYRDGTQLNSNAGDSLLYRSDANGNNHHMPCCITHYVTAGSTNSTTFTLFFCNQWGGIGYISRDWGFNQFTVMEISA
jgi:hypothetical protein